MGLVTPSGLDGAAPRTPRLRAAKMEDVDALYQLASLTHMLNLPADRGELERRVRHSVDSFAGRWQKDDPRWGEYVFVLEDLSLPAGERVIGTSAIYGQHGSRIAPHISFEVGTEENYSPTLDVRMVHRTLELVHSYEGPTEIGGLLLLPKHRKAPTEVLHAIRCRNGQTQPRREAGRKPGGAANR